MNLSPYHLRLLRDYNVPGRFYHGVSHVLELLELHETGSTRGIVIPNYAKPVVATEKGLIDAIVCHDVFYEIGRPKGWNEEQSFLRLLEVKGVAFEPDMVNHSDTETLVRVTITHDPEGLVGPGRPLFRRMVAHMSDLDMSPLGADWPEFRINSANLHREFMHGGVTPQAYVAGRRAFLEKTLASERIFHTPQFHAALEDKARANLSRALREMAAAAAENSI